MIRGIRGATTVDENNSNEMAVATEKLLKEMIRANNVRPEHVVQMLMSVTEELDAIFPAAVVRKIDGWTYVPVMCMREIPVQDSLAKCIRIMMTVETDIKQEEIQHIYMEKAIALRPDLSENKN